MQRNMQISFFSLKHRIITHGFILFANYECSTSQRSKIWADVGEALE